MSVTIVKAIWLGERQEDFETLRNSYGAAPIIWQVLSTRYLVHASDWRACPEDLWALHRRQDIPVAFRAVLMMTFDRAYVLARDYARAASDIQTVLREASPPRSFTNHWPRIAEIFTSAPAVPALGFWMTSVADDPFCGPWNEALGTYDPIDWGACWSIYDEETLQG